MTFDDVLKQVIDLLQRQGRVSYRALKRRFDLDDHYVEDLKEELIHALQLATDEGDRVLVSASGQDKPITEVPSNPPVQEPPQPVSPVIPDAERRHLTVMFCDLVGSTDLSGRLDPEDLREVVRAYQEAAAEVIQHYGGYIAQYLGDGLLIYFGYPVAHEDDARRAVHTGLGIIETIQTLNARLQAEYSTQLDVRLGIHTGPVVIGEMGSGGRYERLALGETPNIAARLEGLAAPNTVVISSVTQRLVESAFALESIGQHELKGVDEPMALSRVLYAFDAILGTDNVRQEALARLIGRKQELDLLLGCWHRAQAHQGQVVLLSGEAGIGKSTLLRRLHDHVSQEGAATIVLRCSPYAQNSDFYPFIALAQQVAGWTRNDVPATKLDKLEQMLRRYPQPLAKTIPLFAALLSFQLPPDRYPELSLTPRDLRQQIVELLVTLALEEAARQPLLIILEDVHWADPSTLEIMGLIFKQVPTAQILIVLAYRPEFIPPWSPVSYMTPLMLNRLERNEVEACILQLAGKALPTEVIRHVIDKTDGVPLYVEELTKMLLESDFLIEDEDRYVLTGPLSDVEIPTTLQGSLMARLDQLQTAKEVAQRGAVLGREFAYEMLQAMVDMEEATLQADLARLVEAELLYQRGVPPTATYIFRHALIRDAAYESLLRRTRQQSHQQAAQLMESRFSDTIETQPELVAYHYSEAGLVDQALTYWQKAGERALQRSAYEEAISHLQAGLQRLAGQTETPERLHRELQFQTTLGTALMATKGYSAAEVERAYSRARELCQQVEETPLLIRSLYGLFSFYTVRAELAVAHEFANQLFSLVERQPDSEFLIEAHRAVGTTAFYQGQFAVGRRHFEQVRTIYNPLKHPSHAFLFGQDPGMAGYAFLGFTRWLQGYPEQELQFANMAVTVAQEAQHVFSEAYALNFLVWCHHFRRDIASTATQAKALMELSSDQGFVLFLAFATFHRGWALVQQGQRDVGLEMMLEGLSSLHHIRQLLWQPYCAGLLAEAYSQNQQVDMALGMFDEALNTLTKTGENWYTVELYRLKGEALTHFHTNRQAEAESVFRQALALAREQDAKSWELRTAVSLGRLWHQQGQPDRAQTLIASIDDDFTEGWETPDLQEAKTLLLQLES